MFLSARHACAIRRNLLSLGDRLLGHPMMERLAYLQEAQWWSHDRILAERDAALRQTILVAYDEVPFYRNLMDKASVTPADIHTAADLRKLPIVEKQMLRNGYPDQVTRRTRSRVSEQRTSGSTGTNFTVLEDTYTSGWYRASFLLALTWAGWQPGEKHAQIGLSRRTSLKRLKDTILSCYYIPASELRDHELDRHLDHIDRKHIQHLWGYPGTVYYLAKRAEQKGWNVAMKSVVTWGDTLAAEQRAVIERVFRSRVHDTYGCGEGIQISAQCTHGTYHIHNLDVIVEYVNADGYSASPDSPGDVILTRLHAGAMPFIRYRVGDMGIAGTQTACPCGRQLERMERVLGRNTDVVVTEAGNRLVVHFFTCLLEHFEEVHAFRVIQNELSTVDLLIQPKHGFSAESERRIIHRLQAKCPELGVRIHCVDELPIPPTGKTRFIISNLPRHLVTCLGSAK